MAFMVTEIIDGDTFRVSPDWNWNGQSGNIVRPDGYDTPEVGQAGYYTAKLTLEKLILRKTVELRNPVTITYGRLLCDVYIDGKNLSTFFPLYQ